MNSENSNITEAKKPEISDEISKNAAMSYFLLLAPVLYLNRKDSEFIQFHAKQGSVLLVVFILFWFLGDIDFFLFKIFQLLIFGVVGLSVLGFIKALKGEKYRIPLVAEISEQGLSPEKIWKGSKRAGKIAGKIILGFFPKKTGDTIAQKLKIDPDQQLLKRIENIEKILIQDKFFLPEISEKISDLSETKKEYFAEIIKFLQQKDVNTKIHEESTFLEISGNFGTIIVGGVHKNSSEKFSYALDTYASETFNLPENSLEFGGFQVGKQTIGEDFLK